MAFTILDDRHAAIVNRVGQLAIVKGALYIIWCDVNRRGDSGLKVV